MANKLKPLEEILIPNSTYQSNKLRKRLIKDGIKKPQCARCWRVFWEGKDIPLELNHINGDNADNRIENVELICPNCHALTDNYRGKNWGKASNKHHYSSP